MTTLHISHQVDDFDGWLATFTSFADFRAEGGVTAVRVHHAVDQRDFVVIDLDFSTTEAAEAFLQRLETEVWPVAPHLDGRPTTRLLAPVPVTR